MPSVSVCNEIIHNPPMCHCWEHPLDTPSIFYSSADVDCPHLFVIPRICTLRVYLCSWLLHASLTLASVDILPPPRKPPLTHLIAKMIIGAPTPNDCQAFVVYGLTTVIPRGRWLMLMCTVVVKKIAIKWNDFFGKYKATAVKPSTLVDVCGGWWMISSPPFAFGYYYQYGDHIGASSM